MLDGTCVTQEVANYVSCVRSHGTELGSEKSKSVSAEIGFLGSFASGAKDVSDKLNRKYSASDKVMMEIIKRCDLIAGIKENTRIQTNQNKDRNLIVYPSTRAYNMSGHEYSTSSLSLVDTNRFKMMLTGLPMRLKLNFDSIVVGDKIPKLEIMASLSRMKHHRFSAVLKDVAVLSE